MRKATVQNAWARARQAAIIAGLALVVMGMGRLYAGVPCSRCMTTVQYDNAHTGWNQDEVVLNIDNVNPKSFGRKWSVPLEGHINLAPLYVREVIIGGEPRNVVYVATASNHVFALDAETGDPVWKQPYFLDTPGIQENLGCGSLGPIIGISSTPVIDAETGTLYAVGLTCKDTPCVRGSAQVFKMAAVDIATGESLPGWPVTIDPPADIPIDTRVTSERSALLLANGIVYVPFGGYGGDCGPYHGWVVGVDKSDPKAPQYYYRTPGTPTHRGSGIWASGGIAADEKGFIYPSTGNSFAAPGLDYSNAVLRLNADLSFSEDPADFFMPSNWVDLNRTDADLGSSTPLLLPPQEGSNTPNMVFVTGKRGIGHLINRDDLGGVGKGNGVNGEGIYSTKVFGSAFSTAAYYEDPVAGPFIFLAGRGNQPDCGTNSGVAALALALDADGNSFYYTAWCTPSMGSAMSPVVTSAPGETGILWVVDRNGVLFAFNAGTGDKLYDSNMVPEDRLGGTRNFLHFTVIDGKVFIGNGNNELVCYTLRK